MAAQGKDLLEHVEFAKAECLNQVNRSALRRRSPLRAGPCSRMRGDDSKIYTILEPSVPSASWLVMETAQDACLTPPRQPLLVVPAGMSSSMPWAFPHVLG